MIWNAFAGGVDWIHYFKVKFNHKHIPSIEINVECDDEVYTPTVNIAG